MTKIPHRTVTGSRNHSNTPIKRKPDVRRLRIINEVTIGAGGHKPARRLVLTTVVNTGKVYPYNSAKRDWRARIDRDAQDIKGPWGA